MSVAAKRLCLDLFAALDASDAGGVAGVLARFLSSGCRFEGVHPFNELSGPSAVAEEVWAPLKRSFRRLHRRQDVLIAGRGDVDGEEWVMSMGHLMGLFDEDWLGIPRTGRAAMVRYAEFLQVGGGKVQQVGFFVDVVDVMLQAGAYPLPPPTGAHVTVPGPRGGRGVYDGDLETDPGEGEATMTLVNRMLADLQTLNKTGEDACPPEFLARTWHEDMCWYGPCGVGTTYTIERYQQQHQRPFRQALGGKEFNGHRARLAEGEYAAWYGWPNLSNTPRGGFLGLPAGPRADMRVVDVYRREGDKLLENWVLIDIPHWLKMQGLDVLERCRRLRA